jgi:uncharacterized protein (TIGR00725 family)
VTSTVAVFGASGSLPGDDHYEEAVMCGRLLALAGFTVATGGYGGTMEAVSLGAAGAGGTVIGVTVPAAFPQRSGANRFVAVEHRAESLIGRVGELVDGSDASIALWGSLGTATELLAAWNVAFVARLAGHRPKPVVAVGDPWAHLVPHLEGELASEAGVVTLCSSVAEAVETVRRALGQA